MEANKRHQNFIGDNPNSKMVLLTDVAFPRIQITYGGADASRGTEEIDAEQFVGVKGFKAKGKRLTTWTVDKIEELEPTRFPKRRRRRMRTLKTTSRRRTQQWVTRMKISIQMLVSLSSRSLMRLLVS